MFKNGTKPKIFLKKKSDTNRIMHYPNLNQKLTSNYKSIFSPSTKSKNQRKQLNRTSSAFLDRNYNTYIKKIIQEKNFVNSSMIESHKLNSILFKLKGYYNELMAHNNTHYKKIHQMLNIIEKNEERFTKMKELKNIELPTEKIEIQNYNSLKLTKGEIEKSIFDLINQKKDIEGLMKDEEDFNKTLECMIEAEQNQLFITKNESLALIDKLANIKKYQKIVNDNIEQNEKKEFGYNILKKKIFNDIKLVQKINSSQDSNIEKLTNEIKHKELEIKNLEEKIQQLKEYENVDIQSSKEELKEKIKNAKEFEQKRLKDEKKCIDIINSLTLIQNYFCDDDFDNDNFKKEKLIKSKEYQQILQLNQEENKIFKIENKRYIKEDAKNNDDIPNYNNSPKKMNSMFSSTFSDKKFFDSNNSIKSDRDNKTIVSATFRNRKKLKSNKAFKKLGNKTSSTFYQTRYDFNSFYNNDNNCLNELIMKFNNIKITKEEVFNYINNLLYKLSSYLNQMNYIHNKEINLEEMKSKLTIEVKNIISNNYFNFEELTNNNEKCKVFLENNIYFLNKMKKANHKRKMEKILKKIEKNEKIQMDKNDELSDGHINNISKNDFNIDGDNILFKLSHYLIINIKNFFIFCSDFIKDIYIAITNNKKLTLANIEKDKTNAPFIEVLKKLYDYDKNKDIVIADDYKLLLQYIKNLIKFSKDHKNILPQQIMDDINSNLIEKFYKPGEVNKKLDKIFINRFLAKKIPNYNNIFNHFTLLSDQVIENVKAIYDLVKSEENKLFPKEKETDKLSYNIENQNKNNENGESENDKLMPKKKKYQKFNNTKSVDINTNSTYNVSSNKFSELSEDIENIDEINSSGKKIINIKKKWKVKSLDKKITNKLYKPFLEKTIYLRQINPNIPGIKQMTSRTSKASHQIKKKIGEVNIISHQINIYNNPNIDPNKLCDNTYNSLVKLINNSTKRNNMRSGKYRYFFDK